jgi:hypothetical protein
MQPVKLIICNIISKQQVKIAEDHITMIKLTASTPSLARPKVEILCFKKSVSKCLNGHPKE